MKTWHVTLIALVCGASVLQGQTVGVLQGRAATAAVEPLQGVRITVSRLPDTTATKNSPAFLPWVRSVVTDLEGNFQVTGIPAGTYRVCAEIPDGIYLDPCRWDKPIDVEIATKKTNETVIQPITMEHGVLLFVRIEDPAERLTETFGKKGNGAVLVSIDGMQAKLERSGARELLYRMAVPRNKARKVEVASPGISFRDGLVEGRKLSKDVTIGGGGLTQEVLFTVAGLSL